MLKCHTHVVQVHLQPVRYNSFLKCVAAENCKKFIKNLYLGGLKVIQGHRR